MDEPQTVCELVVTEAVDRGGDGCGDGRTFEFNIADFKPGR